MPVTSWSTTASSNATADSASGIVWSEGQAPSSINDSARAMMAVIKGDLANSLAANGYQKLPNGLIIQWGTASITSGGGVTFPITFPTALASLQINPLYAASTATRLVAAYSTAVATTGFNVDARYADNGGGVGGISTTIYWLAVGY